MIISTWLRMFISKTLIERLELISKQWCRALISIISETVPGFTFHIIIIDRQSLVLIRLSTHQKNKNKNRLWESLCNPNFYWIILWQICGQPPPKVVNEWSVQKLPRPPGRLWTTKGSEYMLVGGIRTGAHTKALPHESGSGLERINACCGMD